MFLKQQTLIISQFPKARNLGETCLGGSSSGSPYKITVKCWLQPSEGFPGGQRKGGSRGSASRNLLTRLLAGGLNSLPFHGAASVPQGGSWLPPEQVAQERGAETNTSFITYPSRGDMPSLLPYFIGDTHQPQFSVGGSTQGHAHQDPLGAILEADRHTSSKSNILKSPVLF